MKIGIFCIFLLFLSSWVISNCQEFDLTTEYNNMTEDCYNLVYISIIHDCDDFLKNSSCFYDYKELQIILPNNIVSDTINLQIPKHQKRIQIPVNCIEPGVSTILLSFDNQCKREIILNLTKKDTPLVKHEISTIKDIEIKNDGTKITKIVSIEPEKDLMIIEDMLKQDNPSENNIKITINKNIFHSLILLSLVIFICGAILYLILKK